LTVELLLDNSAWARLNAPTLAPQRVGEIALALETGRLAVCLPFLLEAGYSARNAAAYEELLDELVALPLLAIDRQVEQRALHAQRQLARVGHHRLPPVDVMLAAIADRYDVGVLHYDADYDVLSQKTDLVFESAWLAPRGTL